MWLLSKLLYSGIQNGCRLYFRVNCLSGMRHGITTDIFQEFFFFFFFPAQLSDSVHDLLFYDTSICPHSSNTGIPPRLFPGSFYQPGDRPQALLRPHAAPRHLSALLRWQLQRHPQEIPQHGGQSLWLPLDCRRPHAERHTHTHTHTHTRVERASLLLKAFKNESQ